LLTADEFENDLIPVASHHRLHELERATVLKESGASGGKAGGTLRKAQYGCVFGLDQNGGMDFASMGRSQSVLLLKDLIQRNGCEIYREDAGNEFHRNVSGLNAHGLSVGKADSAEQEDLCTLLQTEVIGEGNVGFN
jgi:hypothetical protein